MKYRRLTLISLVGVIAFTSGGWLFQGAGVDADARRNARTFQRVIQLISRYYVDSLDESQLYDMAIDGMLDQLNDPYTSFLRRQGFQELSINTTGSYGGVGLRIDLRDGWVTVVTPIADSPAERAGLTSGDQIVEIEGRSTKGWSTQDAADVLRGDPGTRTEMTVVRAGFADSLHFTLTRDHIHVNSVEGVMMLGSDVGYMRLITVSEDAATETRQAVDSLRAMGARTLILDLRGNPGGILDQGVALADLFLDRNEVVVETRGRAPQATATYRAEQDERWPDLPVVALVNRQTASAAEILAGALQDHDRALLVGTPTFGKGVAYFFLPLTETEAVTVTSSRWYTPSGRSIQRQSSNAHPRTREMQALAAAPVADSTAVFVTDGGRRIQAGSGGIQPDVVVTPDTLTDAERAFADALGSKVPVYNNVMSRYALEAKGEHLVESPDFRATDAMLHGVLDLLHERGVEMDSATFFGAKDLIAERLESELTRYAFGREAELRRLVLRDRQVERAVSLLERSRTPEELITRVGAEAATGHN